MTKSRHPTPLTLAWMNAELWSAAAVTVALRSQLLLAPTDPLQFYEWQRMVCEKVLAGSEVWAAAQRAALDLWLGSANPWAVSQQLLAPLHGRATANARRLSSRRRPRNALYYWGKN